MKFGCGKREQTRWALAFLQNPTKRQPHEPIPICSASFCVWVVLISQPTNHILFMRFRLTMPITARLRMERLNLHSVYSCLHLTSIQISVVHVHYNPAKLQQPLEISLVYAIATRPSCSRVAVLEDFTRSYQLQPGQDMISSTFILSMSFPFFTAIKDFTCPS